MDRREAKWTWNPLKAYRQWKQAEKILKGHEVAGPLYSDYVRSTNVISIHYLLGMTLVITVVLLFGLGVLVE